VATRPEREEFDVQSFEIKQESADEITQIRPDEEFRMVVSQTGDWAKVWIRAASNPSAVFPRGAVYENGEYRMDGVTKRVVANSWEELVVGLAQQYRVIGIVALAYTATGAVHRARV
jgi:hypothetical protein